MRLKGWIGWNKVMLLVDSGSTHNFINPYAAKKAGLVPAIEGKLNVLVANDEKLVSGGICRGVSI